MDDIVRPLNRSGARTRVADAYGRGLRDLRVSVIDRCNLRCRYCMPKEVFGPSYSFLPKSDLLTFEEIVKVVRSLVPLGVEKVRLTGGEPLLRRGLEDLVARLAEIGVADIAITTNGLLLDPAMAHRLKAAGLARATVSLDALDAETFRRVTGGAVEPRRVLAAIEAARAAGLGPVKINMVVQRGLNERAVVAMAEHFRGSGHILRFIEYMDVGNSNGWSPDDVVSAAEIRAQVERHWPLEPLPRRYPGEVARRYCYRDGGGEIGFIASVTQPFCGGCSRLRLTADGRFYTCLFAGAGHDLRGLLRSGADAHEISERLESLWLARSDRYSELRKAEGHTGEARPEMWQVGG